MRILSYLAVTAVIVHGLIHLLGFALLLGLMVVVTISDIRSGPEAIDWGRIIGQ